MRFLVSEPTAEEQRSKMLRELGEPVMADMPEELRRTKRNFLALATFMLFYQWSGISISQAAPLGIEISVIDPKWILWAFFAIGSYTAIQFVWLLYNYCMEIRIRLTGGEKPYTTVENEGAMFGGEGKVSPIDSRQASLHFWWANMRKKIPGRTEIEAHLNQIKQANNASDDPQAKTLNENIGKLNNTLAEIRTVLSSQHIQISLDRYETGFNNFSRSQRWRFYLLDAALPILLGLLALGWTSVVILCPHLDATHVTLASLPDLFR